VDVRCGRRGNPGGAAGPDTLADVLSRLGDSTGANPAWEQAAARLQAARVEAFGDPALIRMLQGELADSLRVQAAEGSTPQPATTLAICFGEPGAALAGHCWEKNIPLLRLRLAGRRAILGPLVHPAYTPCAECLTAEDPIDEREPVAGDAPLAVALFAREVFALISRAVPSVLPVRWRSVDLDTLAYSEHSSATRPGCPRCSIAEEATVGRASLAARYEAAVALPPKPFADVKAHQAHYKPSNMALQQRSKSWPVAPIVPLPRPPLERLETPSPGAATLGGEELSLLLMMMAGIQQRTEQRVYRWTASGGNIGSVTPYVVIRDVAGFEPGIYGYALAEHRLARLSPHAEEVPEDAPVTLMLTGDFPKVAQKYGAFALRIVLLDSGCAQATARSVARALGLRLRPRFTWNDEAISRALGTQLDSEPITAVLDLGGKA